MQALEQELRAVIRLVALSYMQFQTGFRMPVSAIGQLAHDFDAYVLVDAIQAVGVVDVDVSQLPIDFLACGSHKWLMGLEGVGFIYVEPDALAALTLRWVGWRSHQDALAFLSEGPGLLRYDRPLLKTIQFLEAGAPNALGHVALEAGLDPILALRPRRIFEHVQTILDRLEEGLLEWGWSSLRGTTTPETRSGILAVQPPLTEYTSAFCQALNDRGVICTMPDGLLRFSQHWPNDLEQAHRVLEIVDTLCQQTLGALVHV